MQGRSSPRIALVALAVAAAFGPGGAAAQAAARPMPAAAALPGAELCPAYNPPQTLSVALGTSAIRTLGDDVEKVVIGNPGGDAGANGAPPPAAAPAPTNVTLTNAGTTTTTRNAKGQVTGSQTVSATKPRDARTGIADVDVRPISRREIYVVGKSVGATNFIVVERSRRCTEFFVTVGVNTRALEATLKALAGEAGVTVTSAQDAVILSGTVRDNDTVARIGDIASAYFASDDDGTRSRRVVNLLEVDAPQQVMLEVKVAEISKALLDKFGIDFSRAYAAGDGSMLRFLSGIFGGTNAVGGQFSGTTGAMVGGGVVGSATNGQATSIFTGPIGDAKLGENPVIPLIASKGVTNFGINAQKTDGLVKVLAEPTVMAISGQTGSFLAGGKVFIPVVSNDGGARSITLEEKEFGVSVKFTPTVLGSGRINLKVRPEVSELNAAGITISGGGLSAVLPSFTSRRAETTVQLMDGQSFAIGGLIKNNSTTNIKAFPLLGELPVIGALFRSTEFQTDRSELVFVITPRLVKPLPADYKLPTDHYVPPTRSELIFEGKLEGSAPADPRAPAAPAAAPGVPGGGIDGGTPQEKK